MEGSVFLSTFELYFLLRSLAILFSTYSLRGITIEQKKPVNTKTNEV